MNLALDIVAVLFVAWFWFMILRYGPGARLPRTGGYSHDPVPGNAKVYDDHPKGRAPLFPEWEVTEYHFHLIEHLLRHIIHKGKIQMQELDAVIAAVTRNGDVDTSILTLVTGMAAQITAASGNPAKLAELAATLTTQADAIAAAVVANTPVAPPA